MVVGLNLGSEAALFNTAGHFLFKLMDLMPRKPSKVPQPFILKTMENQMHVVDSTCFEQILDEQTFGF